MALFLFVLMLIGPAPSYASAIPQKSFVGCFNRVPDGEVQFGAVPSGELFTLRGDTDLAARHVNQLVRVFGDLEQSTKTGASSATLTLLKVQVLAGSCTSVLPSAVLDGIPGKVGGDAVAVPLTDTSTEDQTTPGFQTEAASTHSAGAQAIRSSHGESAVAPANPEQVGQSESTANLSAGSVERTEILPGTTLGVGGSY